MTDVITTPAAGEDVTRPGAGAPDVQWAPPVERPRRRWPLVLGIGLPAAAVIGAAWWAGANLIAPGVSVAGVPVGLLTTDAAAERITDVVATTGVEITAGSATATISGADLGASVDAAALAAAAHSENPLWMIASWFPETAQTAPSIDAGTAEAALQRAFTSVWTAPTDAQLTFDAATATYVVTPGVPGEGLPVADVTDAYLAQLQVGDAPTATIDLVTLEPAITTDTAATQAEELNAMLTTAGFYVGEERTVPLDAAFTASWLTVIPDPDSGSFTVSADATAIQQSVDTLPALVNRDAVSGTQIVNTSGTVLRESTPSLDGRVLGDTEGVAAAFAEQLADGNGVYPLEVQVTAATPVAVARLLEVDISEQRLYLKENGVVVDSWLVSTGSPGADTPLGTFRVQTHVRAQTMSGVNSASGASYSIPNVQYVMYFQGDYAFHGVHWRSNWGQRGSNGCVGMSNTRAKQIYEWAPNGTDIYIHM